MKDIDRALADISDIHSQMASSRRFRGFGPSVVAATGALALLLSLGQILRPPASDTHLLYAWVGLAFVSAALVGAEMFARTRRLHGGLADGMMSNAIEGFLPAGAAGAAIGGVLAFYSPDTLWVLPGLWQILLSLGIFAVLSSLPRKVAIVAAWYFISGIACLILASKAQGLSPWLMGIPFSIGQFLMAAILHVAMEPARD